MRRLLTTNHFSKCNAWLHTRHGIHTPLNVLVANNNVATHTQRPNSERTGRCKSLVRIPPTCVMQVCDAARIALHQCNGAFLQLPQGGRISPRPTRKIWCRVRRQDDGANDMSNGPTVGEILTRFSAASLFFDNEIYLQKNMYWESGQSTPPCLPLFPSSFGGFEHFQEHFENLLFWICFFGLLYCQNVVLYKHVACF